MHPLSHALLNFPELCPHAIASASPFEKSAMLNRRLHHTMEVAGP
jgi:hypothetical protein